MRIAEKRDTFGGSKGNFGQIDSEQSVFVDTV